MNNELKRISFSSALFDSVEDFVFIFNTSINLIYINAYTKTNLGFTLEELAKYKWDDLIQFRNLQSESNGNETKLNNTLTLKNKTESANFNITYKVHKIEGENQLVLGRCKSDSKLIDFKYKNILNSLNDIVYTTNAEGIFTYINNSVLPLTGFSSEELIGKHYTSLLHPDFVKSTQEFYYNQFKNKQKNSYLEFRIKTKNGDFIWIGQNVTIESNESGHVLGFQAVVRDITQEINQREELKTLSLVAKNVSNGVVICDNNGLIEWCNDSFLDLVEYTLDELIGKRPIEIFSGEATDQLLLNKIKRQNIGDGNEVLILNYTKTGKKKWFLIQHSKVIVADRTKQIEIISDFTDRQNAELLKADLAKFKERINQQISEMLLTPFSKYESLKHFFEAITEKVSNLLEIERASIWFLDGTGIICRDLFEVSKGQHSDGMFLRREDFPIYFNYLETGISLLARDVYRNRNTIELADVYMKSNNIYSLMDIPIIHNGKLLAVLCCEKLEVHKLWSADDERFASFIATYVSQCYEAHLREETNKKLLQLSQVAEKSTNIITISDADGNVEWVNKAFTDITEYTLDEVKGKYLDYLRSELTNKEAGAAIDNGIKNRRSVKQEILNLSKSGNKIWLDIHLDPVTDEFGNVINYIGIQQNITEKKQKEAIIENQSIDILNGVNYAKRIQIALLPKNDIFEELPIRFSVYNKPKDIIGGDFYWIERHDDLLFLAVGDSTGHGVPGALMTILGMNGLTNAVIEKNIIEPSKILAYLNQYLISLLQYEGHAHVKDGIDISLSVIDLKNNTLTFAGAKRPLVYLYNNEIHKIEGTKLTIGETITDAIYYDTKIENFSDCIFYMLTDGMTDQFGGDLNKKIGYKKLIEEILNNSNLPPVKQIEKLHTFYNEWTFNGKTKQTDDMLLLIFKLEKE
jgi:PAS domain S-box-containing protein